MARPPLPAYKIATLKRLGAELAAREAEELEWLKRELSAAPPSADGLVDAVEAGKLLGLSARSVRQMAWRGTIPVVRVGRRLRFRRADLAKLQR